MKHVKMTRIALAAFIATVSISETKAAYWDWKGKSEGVSYFDDKNCWVLGGSGSSTLENSNHWIGYGKTKIADGWDKFITSKSAYTINATLNIKYDSLITFVAESDENYGITARALNVGQNDKNAANLNSDTYGNIELKSGVYNFSTVTVAATASKKGAVKITGATLETGSILGGGGLGVLDVDGGVIRATVGSESFMPANANFTVTVGVNGAMIDNNGKSISIGEDFSGEGVLVLTGNGTTAFINGVVIENDVSVDSGTTIAFTGAGQSKLGRLTLSAGSVISVDVSQTVVTALDIGELILPGDGKVTLKVCGSALPAGRFQVYKARRIVGDLANLEIVSEVAGVDGKSASCVVKGGIPYVEVAGEGEAVWCGCGDGVSFNDNANWVGGATPAENSSLIFNALDESAILNCNIDGFTASSITFMAGTPSFTITGKEISGVLAVTNNSPNMIELENPVNFVTYVDVRQNPGVVKFIGGATGVVLPRASNLYGTYNFTVTGNYIEKSGTRVKNGGVYKLLNATFHKHNADFTVDEGARAEVMNAKIQQDTSGKTLLNILDGEFVVTNEFLVSGDGAVAYAKHKVCNGGSGAMVLNSLRVNQIGCLELPPSPIKLILGAGGLIRGKGYVCVGASGVYEIGSYADWSMYYTSLGGYKSTTRYAFYKDTGADTWSDLVFDTTDWYDKSLARTITAEAPICAVDDVCAAKFRVTVKGNGTFVFANTSDDGSGFGVYEAANGKWFTGGLIVTNSATVAVKPGCRPGKGALTVHKGASLKVPQSATVSLENELNFNDGAILGFHFTSADTMPVLNVDPEKVNFAEGASKILHVRITADDGIVPVKGEKVLTSGGGFKGVKVFRTRDSSNWAGRVEVNDDGNIVLKDKVYFYISVE